MFIEIYSLTLLSRPHKPGVREIWASPLQEHQKATETRAVPERARQTPVAGRTSCCRRRRRRARRWCHLRWPRRCCCCCSWRCWTCSARCCCCCRCRCGYALLLLTARDAVVEVLGWAFFMPWKFQTRFLLHVAYTRSS